MPQALALEGYGSLWYIILENRDFFLLWMEKKSYLCIYL